MDGSLSLGRVAGRAEASRVLGTGGGRSGLRARTVLLLTLGAAFATRTLPAINLSEIHHDPPGSDSGLEFVEIVNDTPTVMDISGWSFTEGIVYTFPQGTLVPGWGYLVLCQDEGSFREAWPTVTVTGVFEGRLDSNGEALTLSNNGGGVVFRVKYASDGKWPAAAAGTGHTLSIRRPWLDPSEPESWTASALKGGTPGAENFQRGGFQDTEIVKRGDLWYYRKGTQEFSTPVDAWRQPGFTVLGWSSGPTGIGYGDNDDATVLDDMLNGYMSIAARRTFTLTQSALDGADSFVLSINYDDGFVAYANGVEFARSGLGNPGTPVAFDAAAASHEASGEEEFEIPKARLVAGSNAIAIQCHNISLGSSDFSFAPRVLARKVITPGGDGAARVVINELLGRTAGSRWVELHGLEAEATSLEGWHLSDDASRLDKYTFPAGTSILPRGHLVVTAAQCGLDLGAPEVRLFLSAPGLERVVDARTFSNVSNDGRPGDRTGHSEARFPDGSDSFGWAAEPTPGGPNVLDVEADVVIDEIFYHPPPGHPAPEFVELHNLGASPVDVGGWAFTKGIEYAFPEGTTIPAEGFLVVSANPTEIEEAHGTQGVLGPFSGVLSDGGENLRLVDRIGNVVDEVRYHDGGRWSRWADGGGSSLELIDPRQDNSLPSAWESSDESDDSEWTRFQYTSTYVAEAESEIHLLLLDEGVVRVDGLSVLRSGSATEHVANGSFEGDASTWRFLGTHVDSARIAGDGAVGSACLEVRASGPGDQNANKIEADTASAMSNGTYNVTVWARWIRGSNRLHVRADNTTSASLARSLAVPIPRALGTPGARNGVRRVLDETGGGNLGPVIGEVTQDPVTPDGSQAVQVRALVRDADGVARVEVLYRTGGLGDGIFARADLLDDGAHGDGEADDGVYGGTIPAFPRGSRVAFYISARDSRLATRTFPVEAPERLLLYSVEAPVSTAIHLARLNLPDESEAELGAREATQLHSDQLVDASFTLDDEEIYYNVGVRYHGSPWNRPPQPRMYRVRFNEDQPFRRGLKALNISRYGSAQNEGTAYLCVQSASAPSSPGTVGQYLYSRVYHNTAFHGLLALVETVDTKYLDTWFPGDSDGYLFKIPGRRHLNDSGQLTGVQWTTLGYRGGKLNYEYERYRWYFAPSSRQTEDEWGPIVDLCTVMDTARTTTTAFDRDIEKILDVEQFLRVEAARTLQDDWDTIGIGNGQNAYIYFAPGEGRWKLLPWDMDHTFGNVDAKLYPEGSEAQITRLVQRPKYRRMYLRICADLLRTVYDPDYIGRFLAETQRTTGINGDGIRGYIATRRSRIQAMIPSGIAFRLTNIGLPSLPNPWDGTYQATREAERVRGTAPIEVASFVFLRDGEDMGLAVSWASTTQWMVDSFPFAEGAHRYEVLGFDDRGSLTQSLAFTATFGEPQPPPRVASVDPTYGIETGGTSVRVAGSDFRTGARVFFGAAEASRATFVSATEIQAVSPAGKGKVAIRVTNPDNASGELPAAFEYVPAVRLIRGDANLDGLVDLSDAVKILGFNFLGDTVECLEAADVDDSSTIEISDPIGLLGYLFLSGAPPAPPFPDPGPDPDGIRDGLDCDRGL